MTFLWLLAAGTTVLPTPHEAEVVVTGSRVASSPDELAANVTVLRREDFDVEKPADLPDLLRRVAGVHVDTVGGRGGTGSIYMRGADPNYTLVLIDGVRVNDPTNSRGGSFDLSTLDIADVERVEIARGPYSAIYGGDAMAGVINIVTRPGLVTSPRVDVDAMGGAYDNRELTLNAQGSMAHGSWRVGASDTNEGEVVRGNDFDAQRVSGALNTQLGAATTLVVSGRYSESTRRGFPDDSGGYDHAVLRETERREASETILGAGLTHHIGDAAFALTLGYFDRNDQIDSPGVAPGVRDPFGVPPSATESDFTRYSATLSGTQRFSHAVSLVYGVDWQREQGASDGTLDFGGGFLVPTSFELTRTTWAPFAEVKIDSDFGLSTQAGVRIDHPDDQSSVTSPRVRLAYALPQTGFTIAGSWGKSFKLPSFYSLAHPLVGNPDLLAERGESHEIELSQRLLDGQAHWSATWFSSEFRNAIDFDAGPPPMLVNRNRVDSHGIELAAGANFGAQWSIDSSVTNAKSRIASSGNELRNRPEWRASLGVHWLPSAAVSLSAAATYVGSSLDSSIATGDVRLSAYTLLDVSAVWQLTDRFQAYLAIDNLTDERYEQFVGFTARGIMPRAGVKVSL
ncbi:MAG TPA: TonB-dependent receptor [Povalibacter sp.]|jgi:outer membrane cobalamin receptor|nr:TonB-dependent receptor [Povalibacter sp.]